MNHQSGLQAVIIVTMALLSLVGCGLATPDLVAEAPAGTSTPIPPTPATTLVPASQPADTPTPEPTATPNPTFTPTPATPPFKTPKPTDLPKIELHLRLKNSKGEPVPFSKAELLIDAWLLGPEQIVFPLKTDGNLLVLPLEEDMARKTWLKDDSTRILNYFIYLEAEGYASVRSNGMYFIGTQTQEGGPAKEVVVEFHNGPKTTITKGETKEIELPLREPQNRSLLFVDDAQNPVSEVKVKSYLFWSNSNHCGYPSGAKLLGEGISNKEGRVIIPDGEFEYLLEFEKPLYHLKETSHFDPMSLITYLSSQETVIELHQLNKQPLEMVVRKNGKPLSNKTLFGQWIGCPCGLCPQDLAVTNDKGRISVDEFYPEEWEWIFFLKEDQSEGGTAWEADPKEFSGTDVIEVELSE